MDDNCGEWMNVWVWLMGVSGGSRGGSQGAMEPPFQSRLCTDTVARLQLDSSNKFVPARWLLICIH